MWVVFNVFVLMIVCTTLRRKRAERERDRDRGKEGVRSASRSAVGAAAMPAHCAKLGSELHAEVLVRRKGWRSSDAAECVVDSLWRQSASRRVNLVVNCICQKRRRRVLTVLFSVLLLPAFAALCPPNSLCLLCLLLAPTPSACLCWPLYCL